MRYGVVGMVGELGEWRSVTREVREGGVGEFQSHYGVWCFMYIGSGDEFMEWGRGGCTCPVH